MTFSKALDLRDKIVVIKSYLLYSYLSRKKSTYLNRKSLKRALSRKHRQTPSFREGDIKTGLGLSLVCIQSFLIFHYIRLKWKAAFRKIT
jgi:hypothetical protein